MTFCSHVLRVSFLVCVMCCCQASVPRSTHTCLSNTITLTHTQSFTHHLYRTPSFTHNFHIQLSNCSIHPLLCLCFLSLPIGPFVLTYWKKLTCRVIRSFKYFNDVFDPQMRMIWIDALKRKHVLAIHDQKLCQKICHMQVLENAWFF